MSCVIDDRRPSDKSRDEEHKSGILWAVSDHLWNYCHFHLLLMFVPLQNTIKVQHMYENYAILLNIVFGVYGLKFSHYISYKIFIKYQPGVSFCESIFMKC